MPHLIPFEDDLTRRFLPLTWTRPVFELRCGIWTLREAMEYAYGQAASALVVRDFLAEVMRERTGLPVNEALPSDGMALLLNGRLLADAALPDALPMEGEERRFVASDGTLLGVWVAASRLREGMAALAALPAERVTCPLVEWPWQLIERNGERLHAQAESYPLGTWAADLQGVHLVKPEAIFIHPSARIQPGVVLDASDGPLVIDESATVMANAVIQGPGYVGRGSTVKIAAKIYHETSIGPLCKVGGEVEATIFQGYSNKQHDGFLGHAIVGEWCNFGADTNNSDLKNNYSPVAMWSGGAMRDTGSLFVGLLMGDHSKTGINAMFNTGTVVGVACNLFGGGMPPKVVPSFAWGSGSDLTEHRLADALVTAERVMARRKVVLSEAERRLLTHVFEATSEER